jgi:hypothetical protein
MLVLVNSYIILFIAQLYYIFLLVFKETMAFPVVSFIDILVEYCRVTAGNSVNACIISRCFAKVSHKPDLSIRIAENHRKIIIIIIIPKPNVFRESQTQDFSGMLPSHL